MAFVDNSAERLSELRSGLHLSQQDFAKRIGISQGALSQLESGKTALSLQTITNICQTFNIDCNWLVLGVGSLNLTGIPVKANDHETEEKSLGSPRMKLIPLVDEEARAGYPRNFQDLDYISALDVYRIPGYEHGDYRLFEIEGDSMVPTIYPREIVVTEYVGDWRDLENGNLCVVITEDGVIAKRIYLYEQEKNTFIFKSDNAQYQTFALEKDKVLEIWHIRAKITSNLIQEATVDSTRLDSLEADIKALKLQLGLQEQRPESRE